MSRISFLLFFICCICSLTLQAAPYLGVTVKLLQPDGSQISVRAFGDEYYQRIETMQGYTLVKDPHTGWICYARLSSDGKTFESTGIIYRSPSVSTPGAATPLPTGLGIAPGIKLPAASVRSIANTNKRLLSIEATPETPRPAGAPAPQPAASVPLSGSVVGLTLLIQFPDEAGSFTAQDIDEYLNSSGYVRFSNNGSVRAYFDEVSGGKLDYTNIVAPYYTAQYPKAYYTDGDIAFGQRARELIIEALQALDADGFDFSQLTTNASGQILAINALYAGEVDSAWSVGLWPHQSSVYPSFSADGVTTGRYQITNMSNLLTIGTFCHENGHMLFSWPDLYDYDTGYGSTGIGSYGLMAGGSNASGGRNPTPPNPYLRDLEGWESVEEIYGMASGTELITISNANLSYKYTNNNNTNEHFWIESRTKTGRSAGLPDEGLLIWHVDTAGNNSFEQMTSDAHFMVSVEQADGLFDLENGLGAGTGDLFRADYVSSFDDDTLPNANWWDESASGLAISNISSVGDIMRFTLGASSVAPAQCEFVVISEWNTGFSAVIRITNQSDNVIDSWSADWSFTDGSQLTYSWNAAVSGNNPYHAVALGWNSTINPGATVEFGVQGEKGITNGALPIPVVSGSACN